MSKEEWIKFYQDKAKTAPDIDMNVIKFIANILYHSGDSDTIYQLFSSGYCYYFAAMLRIAFKRGRICMAYPYGHMVWEDGQDGKGIAYDIGGIAMDYEALVPVDNFGPALNDFRHVPGEYIPTPDECVQIVKKVREQYG